MSLTQEKLLEKYHTVFKNEQRRTSDKILRDTVSYAYKYSRLLNLQGVVDTELAIFHCESRFDPKLDGDHLKSFGIGQTAKAAEKRWRGYWLQRGIKLGPFTDLETQVAFTVAELGYCAFRADGDLKEAVRRYNGAGPCARKYVVRIMRARWILFGHQFHLGETAPVNDRV